MMITPSHFTRREFCMGLGSAVLATQTGLAQSAPETMTPTENNIGDQLPPRNYAGPGEVPRRKFGKSDVLVSALALGGHTFATASDKKEAMRIVQEAVDNGITFMDNAWDYHNGRSEEWMGEALEGRRDKVFLMTKVCVHGRDKTVAMRQLEQSLKRLKTDHLDLWQIHEVIYENEPDLYFAPGGATEALLEAKQQGKARFIGFTGHKSPSIHQRMLAHEFPFDAVQLPLNGFDANFNSFEREVLPILLKKGIAPIGMKSMNGTAEAVKKGVITAEEAIRYAMSLPVTTTVSGMNSLEILRQNLKIAQRFNPMTQQEKDSFRQKCASLSGDGRFELYKVSLKFDGAEGREQHQFPSEDQLAG